MQATPLSSLPYTNLSLSLCDIMVKLLEKCLNTRVIPSGGGRCEPNIPRDVPKGHLAVYVGEDYKRYVIKMKLLNHPLFKALLDRAREEYASPSKLWIPCDDDTFLDVLLRCAKSSDSHHHHHHRRISLCL